MYVSFLIRVFSLVKSFPILNIHDSLSKIIKNIFVKIFQNYEIIISIFIYDFFKYIEFECYTRLRINTFKYQVSCEWVYWLKQLAVN